MRTPIILTAAILLFAAAWPAESQVNLQPTRSLATEPSVVAMSANLSGMPITTPSTLTQDAASAAVCADGTCAVGMNSPRPVRRLIQQRRPLRRIFRRR